MGASVDIRQIPGKSKSGEPVSKKEIESRFWEIVEDCQYDNGHGGYTGTFAEAPGLTITSKVFKSLEEAILYINDTAQKWENALAVRVENESQNLIVLGGSFSS